MCNINIIYDKKKKNTKDLNLIMNMISYKSFVDNDDGEGALSVAENNKTRLLKSPYKILFNENCYFLASHQRWATSGKNNDNIHPHKTKDLVMLHNGVIDSLGNEKDSDSKQYLELLQKKYIEHNKDIIKAIQEISQEILGTYSILLYEKKTRKIYYYKEFSTNMYICKGKRYITLSTEQTNAEYSYYYLTGKAKKAENVEHLLIYDVLNNFKIVGKFKEKDKTTISKVTIINDNNEWTYWNKSKEKDLVTYNKDYFKPIDNKKEIVEAFKTFFDATITKINLNIVNVVVPNEYIDQFMSNFRTFYEAKTYKRSKEFELNRPEVDSFMRTLREI